MKRRDNKNRGFTLVELIVVLVILAILAAILVPALLGWIDRSREEKYILEAREVVHASQVQATEEYAASTFDGAGANFIKNNLDKIRALADMKTGSNLTAIRFVKEAEKYTAVVAALTYVAADGTRVLYDRSQTPVYQIDKSGKSSAGLGAPAYKESWKEILAKVVGSNKHDTTTLGEAIRQASESGTLPSLEAEEQAYLAAAGENGLTGLTAETLADIVWKPLEARNFEDGYVLAAGKNHSGNNQNTLANMVYYNDRYYMVINYTAWDKKLKVDNTSIGHATFSKDALENAQSLEYYLENPTAATGKVWVAL